MQVKLIDFGFLLELDLLKAASFGPADILHVNYIAPEMREIRQGRLSLAQLVEAGHVTGLEDLLKANDVWMLGQMLYFLVCRPKELNLDKFYAEHYVWRGMDAWEVTGGLTVDEATARLADLGLQSHVAEKLGRLLFGKMLVSVRSRCKVAQELADEAAGLCSELLQMGQVSLLEVAWPYYVANTGISAHLQSESGGRGKRVALFEPDIKYLKVRGPI